MSHSKHTFFVFMKRFKLWKDSLRHKYSGQWTKTYTSIDPPPPCPTGYTCQGPATCLIISLVTCLVRSLSRRRIWGFVPWRQSRTTWSRWPRPSWWQATPVSFLRRRSSDRDTKWELCQWPKSTMSGKENHEASLFTATRTKSTCPITPTPSPVAGAAISCNVDRRFLSLSVLLTAFKFNDHFWKLYPFLWRAFTLYST